MYMNLDNAKFEVVANAARVAATINALTSRLREAEGDRDEYDRAATEWHRKFIAATERAERAEGALRQLQGWDMLTLAQTPALQIHPHDPYNGWYGVATGDAPWARRLIANGLGELDPTASRSLEGETGNE